MAHIVSIAVDTLCSPSSSKCEIEYAASLFIQLELFFHLVSDELAAGHRFMVEENVHMHISGQSLRESVGQRCPALFAELAG
jgi:hypothetical protein